MGYEHRGARAAISRIRPVSFAAVKKEPLTVHQHENLTILDLGRTAIWDGADLVLLRKTLVDLARGGVQAIGFDMRHVRYLPSGFFSTLCDWHVEHGPYSVRLYSPQPAVQDMLWFRYFFSEIGDDCYALLCEWQSDQPAAADDDEDDEPHAASTWTVRPTLLTATP